MNHHWKTVRLSDLTTDLVAAQSALNRTMIIGIDGHSASGKTTLATRLGAALQAADVLHTDDLAWHQGVFSWDGLLRDDVLPVVRAGRPLRYRPPQWQARERDGWITLAGELDFFIIEGVGAIQPSITDDLDFRVWVETDEPTRAGREVGRPDTDEQSLSGFRGWMAEENAYVVAERPWLMADLITEGGDSMSHDRENEVVVSGSTD